MQGSAIIKESKNEHNSNSDHSHSSSSDSSEEVKKEAPNRRVQVSNLSSDKSPKSSPKRQTIGSNEEDFEVQHTDTVNGQFLRKMSIQQHKARFERHNK